MKLQIGSTGNDVKRVQTLLNLKVDGAYGKITQTAVKTWQASKGLAADGVIGDITWATMFPETNTTTTVVNEATNTTPWINMMHGLVPDDVFKEIADDCQTLGITSDIRLVHFLSQCYVESQAFTKWSENLNYSAEGLLKTFSKHFTPEQAKLYAHRPNPIANRVYANRMGNGDEASNDGWTYRGRGAIDITFKRNYAAFSKFIGEDCVANPDLVAGKYKIAASAFFFHDNDIWPICDMGDSDTIVRKVTHVINPAMEGLSNRISAFHYFNNHIRGK